MLFRSQRLWSLLPKADGFKDEELPSLSDLNFFEPRGKIVTARINKIEQVIDAIKKILAKEPLEKKIIASRYTVGLPHVDHKKLSLLANNLQTYLDELK